MKEPYSLRQKYWLFIKIEECQKTTSIHVHISVIIKHVQFNASGKSYFISKSQSDQIPLRPTSQDSVDRSHSRFLKLNFFYRIRAGERTKIDNYIFEIFLKFFSFLAFTHFRVQLTSIQPLDRVLSPLFSWHIARFLPNYIDNGWALDDMIGHMIGSDFIPKNWEFVFPSMSIICEPKWISSIFVHCNYSCLDFFDERIELSPD